jgi:integrase
MQGTATLLTPAEMAYVLEINPQTLDCLVRGGSIPHTYIQLPDSHNQVVRFSPYLVAEWLQTNPRLDPAGGRQYLDGLRQHYKTQFATTLRSIKTLDTQFSPKRIPKGYHLIKVPSKKYGFLYYVRYTENGQAVYSRWNTHTNNREAAEQFAKDNKEHILAAYHERKEAQQTHPDLYSIMKRYYKKDSPYLALDVQRGRTITEPTRRTYQHFMADQWVPYLKKQRVTSWETIDTPFMARFQNHCLRQGKKPQTIAHYISTISLVFDHLLIEGIVTSNPCTNLTAIRPGDNDRTSRGCYELDSLHGAFNRRWNDHISYLLCLLIYTTGMRNSEIERIRVPDLITIAGTHFINIPKSKTNNGVRIVPLHDFVYQKMLDFINEYNKSGNDYLFSAAGSELAGSVYTRANLALAKTINYPLDKLAREHITFYSGRHYWKTLVNAYKLGDVEEYFMGHKVSGDVAKRYNHRDKQGQHMLIKKAKEVFLILNKVLFT